MYDKIVMANYNCDILERDLGKGSDYLMIHNTGKEVLS